jgi:hypothetical protein
MRRKKARQYVNAVALLQMARRGRLPTREAAGWQRGPCGKTHGAACRSAAPVIEYQNLTNWTRKIVMNRVVSRFC